jgi:hypothetical protein
MDEPVEEHMEEGQAPDDVPDLVEQPVKPVFAPIQLGPGQRALSYELRYHLVLRKGTLPHPSKKHSLEMSALIRHAMRESCSKSSSPLVKIAFIPNPDRGVYEDKAYTGSFGWRYIVNIRDLETATALAMMVDGVECSCTPVQPKAPNNKQAPAGPTSADVAAGRPNSCTATWTMLPRPYSDTPLGMHLAQRHTLVKCKVSGITLYALQAGLASITQTGYYWGAVDSYGRMASGFTDDMPCARADCPAHDVLLWVRDICYNEELPFTVVIPFIEDDRVVDISFAFTEPTAKDGAGTLVRRGLGPTPQEDQDECVGAKRPRGG